MEITTIAPGELATILRRARAARESGAEQEAYDLFAQASELDPNDAEGWRGRAQTSTNQDDALLSWAYAAALDPHDMEARQSLNERLEARTREANHADAPTLVTLGQEVAQVGLIQDAHALFERVLE